MTDSEAKTEIAQKVPKSLLQDALDMYEEIRVFGWLPPEEILEVVLKHFLVQKGD